MKTFIPITISHWKKGYTYIESVGFMTAKDCMDNFDKNHNCSNPNHKEINQNTFCDYCNEKWKRKDGNWRKIVDHDGAVVEHLVQEITIK